MRRKLIFLIVLLFTAAVGASLISCGGLGALVEDELVFSSDGNGGAVLVSARGYYGKAAVIPQRSPEGLPVVGIGAEAFAGSGITSVTVPEGVTFIDGRAFANCVSLTEIRIPYTVTQLGTRVFEGCGALSAITVEESNSVYYSEGSCVITRSGGVLVAGCGGSVIPEGVSSIASGAFYGSELSGNIVVPEGVTHIGSYAFYGCKNISAVTLPHTLESIGEYAFNGCSAITEIAIPSTVTVLNEGVFRNCTSIVTATLPEGLTVIGDMAFQGCVSLVDPVLPVSLTKLGGLAFSGCVSFIHLKIPKNLTEVGDGAFSYCDMLWGIKVDKENPVFRAETNCLIRRSDGVIVLGTRGSKIPLDGGVTAIADKAFFGAKHLKDIVIPENIRSIGKGAFEGCDYLTAVVIDGASSVGDGAFCGCFSLTAVYLSENVTHMGRGVFVGCSSLGAVSLAGQTVPDGWAQAWNGCGADLDFGCERPNTEEN